MTTPFNAAAYWGIRSESAAACAERLSACLEGLARLHPAFARFYEGSDTLESAPCVASDPGTLASWLERFREEEATGADRDSGFAFALHNDAARLGVRCGFRLVTAKRSNEAVLRFCIEDVDLGLAKAILECVATTWSPCWAVVCTDDILHGQEHDFLQPLVDWLVYVDDNVHIGGLPPYRERLPMASGTCIVARERPLLLDNDAGRKSIHTLRRALAQAAQEVARKKGAFGYKAH